MADKTPVRVVFNGSNVATGMAEFQTGETVPVANGGTGLASIGSAGQVLKVNTAGNGLEFSGEGDLSITNLVAPSNADLNLRTSGTGGIILNDITISDNAISTNRSNDDFKINASGTGTVNLENLKIGTGGATVTTILDEDSLTSNSATSLATQQSIKAYVDSEVTAVSTTSISQGNSNVTVVDSGTGNVTIEVDGTDRITTLATTTTTATGHSLVIGAGSTSAAGQIKFLEGTDNGTNGATLIGPAATTDVTVTLPAATDTLVGKATADTFTNKTIDANGTGNSITNLEVADLASGVLDTDITSVSGSDDTLASAKAIKTYVDAQVTASDLDFATDDSTALSIDLDSESLQVSGGANISTSGSANTITIALDTALAGLTSVTSTALVTNSISSSDSTAVRIDDALNVDGALDVGAGFTISNTTSITSILDEDAMGSDSATALATQQSIKAYVDAQDAAIAGDTLTLTNKTIDADGTGNNISNIDIDNMTAAVVVLESEGISSNDNDTTLPTSAAVRDYADTKAVLTGSTNNQITTVTGAHAIQGESNLTFDGATLAVTGALTVSGDFTVSGSTSTVSSVNTTIADNLIELNTGISQSFNDAGIIIERGSTGNNAAIIWDESADVFVLGTTTATAADKSGGISIDAGSLKIASLEVDGVSITDNAITSNASNANLEINANGSGTVVLENLSVAGDGATVTGILDEDAMGSDSDVKLATQQSIKAYADTKATLSGSTDNTIATVTGAHALQGEANLTFDGSTFAVTGSATITNTSTDDSLLITSTEDSNSAGPVITLKRNSSSPADADYLGRIKFKGENDADQEVQYGSISGKIIDASDGTEDGAIEFNVKKAGSNNIAARLNSDELKLLNGTSLDVNGAGTFGGVLTATSVTSNEFTSNGSNADINLTPAGTGKIVVSTDITIGDDLELISDGAIIKLGVNGEIAITHVHDTGILITDSGGTPTIQLHDANESVSSDGTNLILTSGGTAYKMPTTDGSAGDVLKTDGAGGLSFGSTAATPSDDTRVVVKNNKSVSTSARTMDYFQSTSADLAWYFVALNDLTNDHSSASCFAVAHNNSDAFISGARGGSSGTDNTLPTTSADISSGQVRVKITAPSADSKISYYKIPISRANTADATAGVTVTTSNTDVDSASESIDTFAHASFRAAKYLIIIDDNAKTETGVTEALVVHDGSSAFVTQYGTINTGNNDMITLSAEISGSNVVLSAAGLTPNLSLKIHKTLLSDSMSAVSNANQKIIGATTVSSSATAFDSFDLDDATAAIYYVVGGNGTEGHYSVQEVYCSGAPGEASVSHGPFVSTKATVQLEFTAAFDADEDNTLQLSVSSTSGGSTTVNAYRINCQAE